MAPAFRRRAPTRTCRPGAAAGAETVSVAGTYNVDLKITVEWQRDLGLASLEAALVAFFARPRNFRETRSFLSGHLRETDDTLLPGRISEYRIAPGSLRALLGTLEARGTIARRAGDTAGAESTEPRWLATEAPS